MRVALSGRFRADAEMIVLAQIRDGLAGVRLVAPLELADGRAVLVDRGWAPGVEAAARPEDAAAVEGLLRGPPAGSPFRPDNRPEDDVWYWIDPAAMARAAGLPPADFYVQADGPGTDARYPAPGGGALRLRNEHLHYAIIWFGLAAGLLAVYAAYRRRAAREAP